MESLEMSPEQLKRMWLHQANLGMMAGLAGPKDTIFLDADR